MLRSSSILTSVGKVILTSFGILIFTATLWLWPALISMSALTYLESGIRVRLSSVWYNVFIAFAVTMNISDFLFFCLVFAFIAVLVLHPSALAKSRPAALRFAENGVTD